jgi:hypothetical protein
MLHGKSDKLLKMLASFYLKLIDNGTQRACRHFNLAYTNTVIKTLLPHRKLPSPLVERGRG